MLSTLRKRIEGFEVQRRSPPRWLHFPPGGVRAVAFLVVLRGQVQQEFTACTSACRQERPSKSRRLVRLGIGLWAGDGPRRGDQVHLCCCLICGVTLGTLPDAMPVLKLVGEVLSAVFRARRPRHRHQSLVLEASTRLGRTAARSIPRRRRMFVHSSSLLMSIGSTRLCRSSRRRQRPRRGSPRQVKLSACRSGRALPLCGAAVTAVERDLLVVARARLRALAGASGFRAV